MQDVGRIFPYLIGFGSYGQYCWRLDGLYPYLVIFFETQLGIEMSTYPLSQFQFRVIPQYSCTFQSSSILQQSLRTSIRCLACSSPIYFTPKSSTVNVNQMGLFSCLKRPGVWSTSIYSCSSSRYLNNFLARLPDSDIPYMLRIISQYTNPFLIMFWSWYRSMNSWGINSMGILIY